MRFSKFSLFPALSLTAVLFVSACSNGDANPSGGSQSPCPPEPSIVAAIGSPLSSQEQTDLAVLVASKNSDPRGSSKFRQKQESVFGDPTYGGCSVVSAEAAGAINPSKKIAEYTWHIVIDFTGDDEDRDESFSFARQGDTYYSKNDAGDWVFGPSKPNHFDIFSTFDWGSLIGEAKAVYDNGTATINGVTAETYLVEVPWGVLEKSNNSERFGLDGGFSPGEANPEFLVPVGLWLDSDGRVLKLDVPIDRAKISNKPAPTDGWREQVSFVSEWWDFGIPVDPALPAN